ICLWIVGCVTLWRKESHHLVKFSLLFLLGWLLLPIDVPRPIGILGARYIVPWFLISGLVIALFLGEMTQRFGKLLPLSPLLGLLYYTINVNFQSREVQSVEWGMLLPIVAHRLPPETLPSPSNNPYWSVVAGIQHGWAWRSEKMVEESVLKTAEGWRNTFWSGFGLTGSEVSLAAFDSNERDEYCLGLHINALNSQKPPVQCWSELGVTLRQKRPQSPPLSFEDGVLHRRNHWPVGKTDDFSRGYNHPLSSTRRTLFPPTKKDGNE
ncbi:MAG: hypothetical protein VXZ96_18765, partial [Myxococcota bacterium]|nr:hypothetical protein [Myxococcota bacterium]